MQINIQLLFLSSCIFFLQGFGSDIYSHLLQAPLSFSYPSYHPNWMLGDILVPRYIFLYFYMTFFTFGILPIGFIPIAITYTGLYAVNKIPKHTAIFNVIIRICLFLLVVFSSLYLSASRVSIIMITSSYLLHKYSELPQWRSKLCFLIGVSSSLVGLVLGLLLLLLHPFRNRKFHASSLLLVFCIIYYLQPLYRQNPYSRGDLLKVLLSLGDLSSNYTSIILNRVDNLIEVFILLSLLYGFSRLRFGSLKPRKLIQLIDKNIIKASMVCATFLLLLMLTSVYNLSSRRIIQIYEFSQCDHKVARSVFSPFTLFHLDYTLEADMCNEYYLL